jgi:hypothetical protein
MLDVSVMLDVAGTTKVEPSSLSEPLGKLRIVHVALSKNLLLQFRTSEVTIRRIRRKATTEVTNDGT